LSERFRQNSRIVEDFDQCDHPQGDGYNPNEFPDVGIRFEFVNGTHDIEEEALLSLAVWNTSEPALDERQTALIRQCVPMDP
jgi:hypothetical protein